MPTYDYECVECGHRFEAFQSMSEDPLTECEHCKGPVKRLISGGTGIIFKGSGFYVNDSSKAGKQSTQAAKNANDKTGTDSSKTEVKQESKPESKTADSAVKSGKKESAPV